MDLFFPSDSLRNGESCIDGSKEAVVIPASFAQQRLWFLHQLESGSPVYNIPLTYRVTGPLNMAALEESLREIVRRHESLRTTFAAVDGQPVQVISPEASLKLAVMDFGELPEADWEAEVQRRATNEAQRPLDLARGPLLITELLRLSEGVHVFLVIMHHIVFDDWSMDVFFRELATLYEAYSAGGASPLPELPIQYADFAVWQREWLQGDELDSQLDYWRQQLGSHLSVLELPTDRARPAIQSFRGAWQSLALSKDLTEALNALSHQEGVTLFMTLLAAFKTLLHRYTGQDDIVVGCPIANRSRPEHEGLIGFFVNTLVLRTDLSGNPTFRELLGRVREVCLGAYAHQSLPFEMLVEKLNPKRDLSRNPIVQVTFVFQSGAMSNLDLPGLTLDYLDSHNETAKFDLSLELRQRSGGMNGEFYYSSDLFNTATISDMASRFKSVLKEIITDPNQRVLDISFSRNWKEDSVTGSTGPQTTGESEQFDY
jgi:aspartate racemase